MAQIKVQGYRASGTLKGKARIQYRDQSTLRNYAFLDAYFGEECCAKKFCFLFNELPGPYDDDAFGAIGRRWLTWLNAKGAPAVVGKLLR